MRNKASLLAVATVTALSTFQVSGAGFSLFEQGAKATAMGGAFAATADDPSAIFYNVAGIAYQRDMKAMVGGTLITFTAEFESDPNQPFPGSDASSPIPNSGHREFYEDHSFVLPNMYLIYPIGENITVGIGQFTAFGLRTDWENGETFVGRFISQDANLKTASIQPSFAWKTSNDRFAVGLGLEYRTAHVTLERNIPAINPFTQRIVDIAHVRLDSDWDSEIGWNAGLMFRPNADWSFGVSWRSDMEIDFNGDANFTQVPTGNPQFDAIVATQLPPAQAISTTLPFPSFLHLGVATTMVTDWTIEVNVVRMDWSVFDELVVNFSNPATPDLEIGQSWKDVYSYRIGGNHPVTPDWDIRLGALYDENPQPVEAVGPLLPDSDRWGVSFGVGFDNGRWSVELTEFFLQFLERDTMGRNVDNFNGSYETSANLITIDLGYTF